MGKNLVVPVGFVCLFFPNRKHTEPWLWYWLFQGFPNLHFPSTDNSQPWLMLGKGKGLLWICYMLFMAGSICRSQPCTPWHLQKSGVLIHPFQLYSSGNFLLTSAALLSNTSIKNHTFKHFFAFISLDYNIFPALQSLLVQMCTVLAIKCWPFICAQVLTEIISQQLTACRSHAIRNWKYIPTIPYLLSKMVSYVSSMKIASSLFQIPYIFQPAVSNKACIVAHESV